jgi:hypothetical protein
MDDEIVPRPAGHVAVSGINRFQGIIDYEITQLSLTSLICRCAILRGERGNDCSLEQPGLCSAYASFNDRVVVLGGYCACH